MKKARKPLGGVDMKFYQDMGGHILAWNVLKKDALGNECWQKCAFNENGTLRCDSSEGASMRIRTHIYSPYERRHLLDYDLKSPVKAEAFLNGEKNFLLQDRVHLSSPGFCGWLELDEGWNELIFELSGKDSDLSETFFKLRVVLASGEILGPEYFSDAPVSGAPSLPASPSFSECSGEERLLGDWSKKDFVKKERKNVPLNLAGYQPGVGASKKSAGRFGFNKGDGLLDCSMPLLGMFAKPYLFGHPEYKKSIMWHFSVMPPGIDTEDRFSGNSAYSQYLPVEGESLKVNWIGVEWKKQLKTREDFYHRKKGGIVNFSCSYSIASPGILIESDDAALSLNGLESAGNYRHMILPLSDGWTVRECANGSVYDKSRDGRLKENWVLLWGADSFPDVPIMLTLQKNPDKIIFKRNDKDGLLNRIDIVAEDAFGWCILQFPFGFEVFKPEDLKTDQWLQRAFEKCSLLSKTALAYPVDCKEFYKVDQEKECVEVVQEFSHKVLKDEWNSKAILTAPLPPPLGLIDDLDDVCVDPGSEDFDFPTKYGPLKGVVGSSFSSYSIPLPSLRREFQLKSSGDDSTARMISSDFKEYLAYHQSSEEIPNPGVYQLILQYVIPLLLFNFIDPGERETLEKITSDGVRRGASPETEYFCPKAPTKCFSWYTRTEPYTGLEFMMSYLHISGIKSLVSCDRDTIEKETITFNETDWGNAFSLYSIYLGAMLTDDWSAVEENWDIMKKAFDYFIVLQDWACMATAYREEGITWSDGTNYGAYVAFSRMAEIIGDEEAFGEGLYAYAKLAALRMGLFRSSQKYFYKYLGVEPYWISKCFNEETDASKSFTNAPSTYGAYRPESIYNMTTEGHYPEAWEMYSSFLKSEVRDLLGVVEEAYDGSVSHAPREGEFSDYVCGASNLLGEQELFSWIMMALDSEYYSCEKLLDIIEEASAGHRLSEEFLGASFSHRRVPAKWTYCFLKSQIEGAKFPLAITGWRGLRIDSAEFDEAKNTARLEISSVKDSSWLEIKLRKIPSKVTMAACLLDLEIAKSFVRIEIEKPGILELEF